jgi:hypothetical protein
VPKLSYVAGFAPWGWIVGTGIYVDDVDAAVSSETISVVIQIAVILAVPPRDRGNRRERCRRTPLGLRFRAVSALLKSGTPRGPLPITRRSEFPTPSL